MRGVLWWSGDDPRLFAARAVTNTGSTKTVYQRPPLFGNPKFLGDDSSMNIITFNINSNLEGYALYSAPSCLFGAS